MFWKQIGKLERIRMQALGLSIEYTQHYRMGPGEIVQTAGAFEDYLLYGAHITRTEVNPTAPRPVNPLPANT